ncbi:MAG: hypothetical protein U0183_24870 [Polyangiaceae bacterium]
MTSPTRPFEVDYPILRTVLELRFGEPHPWYEDAELVAQMATLVTEAPFAASLTHAGKYAAPRALKQPAAFASVVAKRKPGSFQALDAKDEQRATVRVSLDIDASGLAVTMLVGAEAYRRSARTLLDEVTSIGLGLCERMRPRGAGLSVGYAHPMARGIYDYPKLRPPVSHLRLETTAIVEILDPAFHLTEHDDALGADVGALAEAPVPPGVRRTLHGDLTVTRWVDDLTDDRAVARAAGRHEAWMAGVVAVKRSDAYSPRGDKRVRVRKSERAPFTFYDAQTAAGYKAILVDPDGSPDAAAWDEMVTLAASAPHDVKAVWLVVPLREHALGLTARARGAGLAGVLFPEGEHLWDPRPLGLWLDDEG